MDNTTYIKILKDILIKKQNLLDKILDTTILQEECLTDELNLEQFDTLIQTKEGYISQINSVDDGFEKVFERVGDALTEKKHEYQKEILELQALIKNITETSAMIQSKEMNIKTNIEAFMSSKKKEIKNYKVSSRTVGNYYKNMSDQYNNESFFLDKKK